MEVSPASSANRFVPWHLKYRPKRLEDLVGQPLVTRTLTNLICKGTVPNALLFHGGKGSGKTSTARILAKSLNCLHGAPTIAPCGECRICRAIDRESCLDYIEVDGASHNGVDDIRGLIEHTSFRPVEGGYKIAVIDEAHMLTKQAQNAFLKTLEEPTPNVLFILATTDANKLLDTITSRCMELRFLKMSSDTIEDRLRIIAEVEGLSISDNGLDAIALTKKGGLRDAIQLLFELYMYSLDRDRIGKSSHEIDENTVYLLAGRITPTELYCLVEAVFRSDIYKLLSLVADVEETVDAASLLEALLSVWRDLLAFAACQGTKEHLPRCSHLSELDLQALLALTDPATLMRQLDRLEESERRMNLSSKNQSLWLQTLLLSLALEGDC